MRFVVLLSELAVLAACVVYGVREPWEDVFWAGAGVVSLVWAAAFFVLLSDRRVK